MNLPRIIIDAVLFCPHCGANHVDEERNGEKWHRRAHTTHRCQSCGNDFDVYVSGQEPNPAPVRTTANLPGDWAIQALQALQLDFVEKTGRDPQLTVSVSEEIGLLIGLPVNHEATVLGPAGRIRIYTRKDVK